MFHDKEKDHRHTAAMERIVHRDPPWQIRWGATFFLFFIFILIIFSTIIGYPDIIKGKIKLISCRDSIGNQYSVIIVTSREDVHKIQKGQELAFFSKDYGSIKRTEVSIQRIYSRSDSSIIADVKFKAKEKGKVFLNLHFLKVFQGEIYTHNISVFNKAYKGMIENLKQR